MLVDDLDDDAEEPVEQLDDLLRRSLCGELGGADDVGEQHRDLARLAAELDALLERGMGDVLADVAAEEVLDPLALAQPGDHAVEAGLQLADLAAVVDGHLDVELAGLDLSDCLAQRDHGVGHRTRGEHREVEADGEPEPAERRARRPPAGRALKSSSVRVESATRISPRIGTAVPSAQASSARRLDPGREAVLADADAGGERPRRGRPQLALG